jgi:hypothetical protein
LKEQSGFTDEWKLTFSWTSMHKKPVHPLKPIRGIKNLFFRFYNLTVIHKNRNQKRKLQPAGKK